MVGVARPACLLTTSPCHVNVAVCSTVEHRILLARLPGGGHDGCEKGRRFEKCSYTPLPPKDGPGVSAEVRELVLEACAHAILQRCCSPGSTETAVRQHLESTRKVYLRAGRTNRAHALAAACLPATYKQVLSIVAGEVDSGLWSDLLRYQMCPCGQLYRCEHKDAQVCPGISAAQPCLRPRAEARSVIYSSIRQFVARSYKDPVVAREFGAWLRRAAANGDEIWDFVDAAAVQDALDADPRFRNDPRCLIVILVTDPFIVSWSSLLAVYRCGTTVLDLYGCMLACFPIRCNSIKTPPQIAYCGETVSVTVYAPS